LEEVVTSAPSARLGEKIRVPKVELDDSHSIQVSLCILDQVKKKRGQQDQTGREVENYSKLEQFALVENYSKLE
jgi:hypothetical protein